MVGICLNLVKHCLVAHTYGQDRQTQKQSPELGHADCAWKVGGAEGELELDLVAVVLQGATGLELACHHLEKCFSLSFRSYIFFSYHLQLMVFLQTKFQVRPFTTPTSHPNRS